MKKTVPYIALIVTLLFVGCKKNNLPPTDSAEPVFYIKGDINGVPVSLQAGVNNYFMYASHYQDGNNVYVYKGELKQSVCNGSCNYGITILINDSKVSQPNALMHPDSGLYKGKYQFNDGTLEPVAYTGMFTPLTSNANTTYTWTYSDGLIQNTPQGGRTFNANKTYSVCLTLNNNGCVQSHTNEFRVGSTLQTNVSAMCNWSVTPTTYSFYSYSPTGLSYQWNFGDSSPVSSAINPIHVYPNTNKYYTARLRLTNSSNDTCYSYYQVPVSIGNPVCHANYNSSFSPVANTKALSAISFLVTDPSGKLYSSQGINQSTGSSVEIISVEDYKNNEQNERTKKVKIRFSCDVKNGIDSLKITNGEAVIAVSYK